MESIGFFVGALVPTAILMMIFHRLLRPHCAPLACIVIANGLSLFLISVLAGFGLANGDRPDFVGAFAQNVLPQTVWLVVGLFRLTRVGPPSLAISPTPLDSSPREASPTAISFPGGPNIAAAPTIYDSDGDEKSHTTTEALAPPTPRRFYNFIAMHWRGEFSLGLSYWGISFLGGIVAAALVALLPSALSIMFNTDRIYDPQQLFWALFLSWSVLAFITLWQLVGVWRSATRHFDRRMKQGKSTGWATAAKFAVAIGFLSSIGQFISTGAPQISETYNMAYLGDPDIPEYALRIMRNGTEIELTGGFKFGLADDFAKALKTSPQIRVVHLNSLGGRTGEAEKLYLLIRKNGLITYVSSRCASVCTLAYSARRERWIDRNGRLGFHGLAFPGMDAALIEKATFHFKELVIAAGYDRLFVERALAVPNNEIWTPSLEDLADSRVVTNFSDGGQFAASGYATGITSDQMGSVLAAAIPAIASLQKRFPQNFQLIARAYYDGYVAGQTHEGLWAELRETLTPLIAKHIALADDAVLIELAGLTIDMLLALNQRDPKLCYEYAVGGNRNISKELPEALNQRDLALGGRVIATSAPRPPVNEQATNLLQTRIDASLSKRFPQNKIALLRASTVRPAQYSDYCILVISTFQEIIAMKPAEAASLLRRYYS